eukprot:g71149.t1
MDREPGGRPSGHGQKGGSGVVSDYFSSFTKSVSDGVDNVKRAKEAQDAAILAKMQAALILTAKYVVTIFGPYEGTVELKASQLYFSRTITIHLDGKAAGDRHEPDDAYAALRQLALKHDALAAPLKDLGAPVEIQTTGSLKTLDISINVVLKLLATTEDISA